MNIAAFMKWLVQALELIAVYLPPVLGVLIAAAALVGLFAYRDKKRAGKDDLL